MQIHVFAKWQVKEGALESVLNTLNEVATQSRKEEGNLFYSAHQSTTEVNTLMLYEGYRDAAALDAHRSSAHFQTLVMATIVPLLHHREVLITKELFTTF